MASIIRFPLILALQLCMVCSIGFASSPVVHIISGMPKNSEPLSIHSKVSGNSIAVPTLLPGNEYQWRAEVNDIYYCTTIWGRQFAAWHAYELARDAGHATIFSLVNEDGFFLSWDKSSWKKIAYWETD
uniref:Plant self-incompatibility S1 n=1 Tax=Davidia involucrata TaxID=16924 RepID=A0A5B7BGQ2_DAVIN